MLISFLRPACYLFILLFFHASARADAPDGYPFMRFDAALQEAARSHKPVFVYFGRYGCGYCDKTNKEAFSSKQVRDTYIRNYVLAYVDSESGKRIRLPSGERITERDVGTRYQAFVTPVFTFMTADGTVLNRLVGVQRIEDLLSANSKVQQLIRRKAR